MSKIIFVIFLSLSFLHTKSLEDKIANMLIIGFQGQKAPKFNYPLAGIILFSKNIKSKKQLKTLTGKLKNKLICIDQEGGFVSRLKYIKTPSAKVVANKGALFAQKSYSAMAYMLKDLGINCNFAPSVDLAINPENEVIVKNQRSFSSDPKVLTKFASIFISEMKKKGILTTLKHFPGHGSSFKDSHDGFVDVSDTWSEKELIPFKNLDTKMIMTAHIFNKNIDPRYPATLSYKTNQILLRQKLGFKGVIVSDDLQMGAISKNYDLKQTLKLAINAGLDMLLFGNQIDKPIDAKEIINLVKDLVKEGKIPIKTIDLANDRINKL